MESGGSPFTLASTWTSIRLADVFSILPGTTCPGGGVGQLADYPTCSPIRRRCRLTYPTTPSRPKPKLNKALAGGAGTLTRVNVGPVLTQK